MSQLASWGRKYDVRGLQSDGFSFSNDRITDILFGGRHARRSRPFCPFLHMMMLRFALQRSKEGERIIDGSAKGRQREKKCK